ncbi:MAG: hypothetical protein HPY60_11395 [Candidatus Methanofastidiosum sp.]|nr:hypothetical protein [Methanofastidiosum sp.]
MPLLPTNQVEEKRPKSNHKSNNSKDDYIKLPKLLPSKEVEETSPDYNKFQNIRFLLLIVLFAIILYILQLNKHGI